jgi:hypothetical protein
MEIDEDSGRAGSHAPGMEGETVTEARSDRHGLCNFEEFKDTNLKDSRAPRSTRYFRIARGRR